MRSLPRLRAMPLATFERDGLKAALRRAGLPCEDVEQSGPLFWRFDSDDDIPAGFAGLELHGPDADQFALSYRCWSTRRGDGEHLADHGEKRSGEWCGLDEPDHWITRIVVSVRRLEP